MDRALDLNGARALILGWAGSRERQLRGVVRWYRERNSEPVTARADVFEAMSHLDGWERQGRKVVERLRAAGDGPIVIHSFSNAGFWMLAAALEQMSEAERGQIRAAVLDSAPGFGPHITRRFYARNATMAMMPLILSVFGRPPALRHPLLTPPTWLFMRIWYELSHEHRRRGEDALRVVRELGDYPLLLLYSTADELVGSRYVEAWRATVQRRRRVESQRWTDSAHIRHMIQHREPYFERTERFLGSVVEVVDPPAG